MEQDVKMGQIGNLQWNAFLNRVA